MRSYTLILSQIFDEQMAAQGKVPRSDKRAQDAVVKVRAVQSPPACDFTARAHRHDSVMPTPCSSQAPQFADKVAALERWCDEHPGEQINSKTQMATEWDAQWKVGPWISRCRSGSAQVPKEQRAAFEGAVQRSRYGVTVCALQAARTPVLGSRHIDASHAHCTLTPTLTATPVPTRS